MPRILKTIILVVLVVQPIAPHVTHGDGWCLVCIEAHRRARKAQQKPVGTHGRSLAPHLRYPDQWGTLARCSRNLFASADCLRELRRIEKGLLDL